MTQLEGMQPIVASFQTRIGSATGRDILIIREQNSNEKNIEGSI